MKYGGGMNELPYPSDLTAAQWALIERLLPAPKPKGRKRRVDLRKITNAILYVLKGGISWRMLPREFAPWKTVYHYFRLWRLAGLWDRIHDQLRDRYGLANADVFVRAQQSWTAKAWQRSKRGRSGLRCCERTKGRKRHIVVDVLGLILAVTVTGANVQDRDGGQLVLKGLKDRFPRLARVWADGVYAGRLVEWAEKTAQFVLDIVCKPKGQIGFSVLPWRWIVERTFAWLGNYRRLARDYEINPRTSEAWIKIAMIHLMVRRLA